MYNRPAYYEFYEDDRNDSRWCSKLYNAILVALSVIFTGFGIYPLITSFGGAGALVPITGFANSIASPAIEYKKEGQVFGIGCKIFTIAGPVILYGIFFSWIYRSDILDNKSYVINYLEVLRKWQWPN